MTDYYDLQSCVIGGILRYPDECLVSAVSSLKKTDFEPGIFQDLFVVISELYQEDIPIDAAIAIEKCGATAESKSAVFYSMENTVSATNFRVHVKMLKERARLIRIKETCGKIAFSGTGDTPDLPADPLYILKNMIEQEEADGIKTKTFTDKVVDYIGVLNDPDKEIKLKTGFDSIDRTLGGGLKLGSLSYIGARPSTGKTTFALNIARSVMKSGKRVLIFSLEMSTAQIFDRMMSDTCNIDYGVIDRRTLSEKQKNRIAQTMSGIDDLGLLEVVDDVYNVEEMSGLIARFRPDLVVVDFIQCVKTLKKTDSRRNEIDHISGALKLFARRYNCHVLCLSQISRDGKSAPKMSDLKESGALEQDGDYIILLHRPYVVNKGDPDIKPEDSYCLLDKNKYGGTGVVLMYFIGQHQRFTERETRYER